jgi:hypothetical protein
VQSSLRPATDLDRIVPAGARSVNDSIAIVLGQPDRFPAIPNVRVSREKSRMQFSGSRLDQRVREAGKGQSGRSA